MNDGFITPEMMRDRIADRIPDYTYATAGTKFLRGFAEPFQYFKTKSSSMFGKIALERPLTSTLLNHGAMISWAEQFESPEEFGMLYQHDPSRLPFMQNFWGNTYSLEYLDMGLDPYQMMDVSKWLPLRMFKEVAGPLLDSFNTGDPMPEDLAGAIARSLRGWTNAMYGSGQFNLKELGYRRLFNLGWGENGFSQHRYETEDERPWSEMAASTIKALIGRDKEELANMLREGGGAHWRKLAAAMEDTPYHSGPFSKSLTNMDYARVIYEVLFGLNKVTKNEPFDYISMQQREAGAGKRIARVAESGQQSADASMVQEYYGTKSPEDRRRQQQALEITRRGGDEQPYVKARNLNVISPYMKALGRVITRPEYIRDYNPDLFWRTAIEFNNLKRKYPDASDKEIMRKLHRTSRDLERERYIQQRGE